MKKIYPLVVLLALSQAAFADENRFKPEAKLTEGSASTWNAGAGITQKLIHLNGEWVNPYGIAYAKVGTYLNGDHNFGGQVGFRYPYYLTGVNKNGYYVGLYAGSIESKEINGDDKTRLGGGVDLSYVWLDKERISTVSVGIGAGEKLKDASGEVVADIEPKLQVSYTLSIGL
ncbi:hypothetical protein IAE19_08225 [Acinetobacter sp. S40]|uniref:hypothetical protein n=1 Tax=unclassified Acinetobacter TaxID=196816 RepID=UPI001909B4B6|nr:MULTISPECIES: hypothetical protein [unclassified Acinetobacter]MBJ9985428.1 hypothetical protein [Acinetobacter sp. S40]MBK0063778.1 hypothetical protein [Acinetobacter sp. S55]MBK0066933.1 hypothetical protein [Acinetobacter sp. S54]